MRSATKKLSTFRMNFLSLIMTVLCMSVCVYVYFKVSKVEKSMILIRQTSLQLPSVEDVSKIASRTVKKQFEFARRKEAEARRQLEEDHQRCLRAEQQEQSNQQQHENIVVSEDVVPGTAGAAGPAHG